MNFDFGEVLNRAWQIAWKHKALWIIGILYGFFVSLMFAFMFTPVLFPMLMQDSRTNLMIVFVVVLVAAFLLYLLALYPVGSAAQGSLTLGVLEAERKMEASSAPELLKRSFPFFWRVLGLMLLYGIGMTLVILLFQALVLGLSVVTLGMAAMCMAPLSILLYPILYGSIVWMELAMTAIIVDDLPLMDAARQGWNVLRNNPLPLALLALIVYFGIGMITGIVLAPAMLPIFLTPLGFMDQEANWIILAVSTACALVFIPLFAVLSGWAMIFTKSTWVLTYLRLTRRSEPQPLLQEATI